MSLVDRIVPAEALRWGPLTREPLAWHEDLLGYARATTQRQVVSPFLPTFRELADVLGQIGAKLQEIRDAQGFPLIRPTPSTPPTRQRLPWRKRR